MAEYFTLLNDKYLKLLNDTKSKLLFEKWSIQNNLQCSHWAFNKAYEPHNAKSFVTSFLQQSQKLHPLPWKLNADQVVIEPVPCSITSLEFFDRILDADNRVVAYGTKGEIRGCFEETIEDFPVADELRQMLLNTESERFALYSAADRRQLLFRLFQHVALGGQWCQYEDYVRPYLDIATLLYKNLLSVQKSRESREVEIRSKCFRLVPPKACSIQDFVYVAVDPYLREIVLCTHKF